MGVLGEKMCWLDNIGWESSSITGKQILIATELVNLKYIPATNAPNSSPNSQPPIPEPTPIKPLIKTRQQRVILTITKVYAIPSKFQK